MSKYSLDTENLNKFRQGWIDENEKIKTRTYAEWIDMYTKDRQHANKCYRIEYNEEKEWTETELGETYDIPFELPYLTIGPSHPNTEEGKKYMKDLITIGLPSKGRLKDKAISYFDNNSLKILHSEKERNYFGTIENKSYIKIIFLHAKEIIQRLGDGTLDIGLSGLDLLEESDKNLRDKINIKVKLDFGNANLVVAVPDDWIDVQTIADLEEVSFDIRSKRNTRLRVATKYPNLTNDFLISKGVTQYKIISSLGATETYTFIGSSEIITDITSTGKTLADNNLRVLKDGFILKSSACMLVSKKSLRNKRKSKMLSFFLKDKKETNLENEN